MEKPGIKRLEKQGGRAGGDADVVSLAAMGNDEGC